MFKKVRILIKAGVLGVLVLTSVLHFHAAYAGPVSPSPGETSGSSSSGGTIVRDYRDIAVRRDGPTLNKIRHNKISQRVNSVGTAGITGARVNVGSSVVDYSIAGGLVKVRPDETVSQSTFISGSKHTVTAIRHGKRATKATWSVGKDAFGGESVEITFD